jgi:deoxyribodipyrimidine photo-lyase
MKADFKEGWGLHWFRRDLRIAGNEAWRENLRKSGGKTLGIFCFDGKFLARPDFSANRFAFFLQTLSSLRSELREQGSDLLVIDCRYDEAFAKLFQFLAHEKLSRPAVVSYGRDYEPYARKRDAEMSAFFKKEHVEEIALRDHLILEPHEVMKDEEGGFYQIYSPFAKKWFAKMATGDVQKRISDQRHSRAYFNKLQSGKLEVTTSLDWKALCKLPDFPFADALESFQKQNQKNVTIQIPEAGFSVAYQSMLDFQEKMAVYRTRRDIPSVPGTSHLSPYLKNGSITSSQIIHGLDLADMSFKSEGGANQYAKEIVWREFYYSILFHRPDVEKHTFLKVYDDLKFENNQSHFARWTEGMTGYPIVDAGMRQLNTTGWMHNRVRMIVASFLTKHLLIDYRWGENYFMKMLLDGDLAPNNGGWQWAASTGCDPQPYFRIFNPWLQSKKFDPDGTYIQYFVPELRGISAKAIHDPNLDRSKNGYPDPIVDHASRRTNAIQVYKKHRSMQH